MAITKLTLVTNKKYGQKTQQMKRHPPTRWVSLPWLFSDFCYPDQYLSITVLSFTKNNQRTRVSWA